MEVCVCVPFFPSRLPFPPCIDVLSPISSLCTPHSLPIDPQFLYPLFPLCRLPGNCALSHHITSQAGARKSSSVQWCGDGCFSNNNGSSGFNSYTCKQTAQTLAPLHLASYTTAQTLAPLQLASYTTAQTLSPHHLASYTTAQTLAPLHLASYTTAQTLAPLHLAGHVYVQQLHAALPLTVVTGQAERGQQLDCQIGDSRHYK